LDWCKQVEAIEVFQKVFSVRFPALFLEGGIELKGERETEAAGEREGGKRELYLWDEFIQKRHRGAEQVRRRICPAGRGKWRKSEERPSCAKGKV
jgi:hypothetical protein